MKIYTRFPSPFGIEPTKAVGLAVDCSDSALRIHNGFIVWDCNMGGRSAREVRAHFKLVAVYITERLGIERASAGAFGGQRGSSRGNE